MNTPNVRRITVTLVVTAVLALTGMSGATATAPVVEDDPGSRAELANLGLAYHLIDAVFNEGDAQAAAALVDDDAVIRAPSHEYRGPQGLLDYVTSVNAAYPGATFTVTAVSMADDRLHVEWRMNTAMVQIDPAERPQAVKVERSGVIEIAVSGGQINDLTLSNGALVFEPVPIAADPRLG